MPVTLRLTVPLPPETTLALFRRASEALQHHIRAYDLEAGRCSVTADFSLRALAAFRLEAQVIPAGAGTTLTIVSRAGQRLIPWTGSGQSQRIAWQIVGKMQELLDPDRYRRLEDADRVRTG